MHGFMGLVKGYLSLAAQAVTQVRRRIRYKYNLDTGIPWSQVNNIFRINKEELMKKTRDNSALMEASDRKAGQKKQAEAWLKANKDAIAAYNKHVAVNGVFSKSVRRF